MPHQAPPFGLPLGRAFAIVGKTKAMAEFMRDPSEIEAIKLCNGLVTIAVVLPIFKATSGIL